MIQLVAQILLAVLLLGSGVAAVIACRVYPEARASIAPKLALLIGEAVLVWLACGGWPA